MTGGGQCPSMKREKLKIQANVKSAELFGLYQPTERLLEYEKKTSILSITKNIWKNDVTFQDTCSKMDNNIQSHLVFI